MLGMPHSGTARMDAMTAFREPVSDDRLQIKLKEASGPEVLVNHNAILAEALDLYEAGEIDALAMIHADVGAEAGWLTKEYDAMLATGADVVSATIRIKNDTGLYSTAVDDTDDPYLARRLTMKEVARLPQNFSDAEVGGPILLNTGLWLVRLGPWCLQEKPDGTALFCFEFGHRIRKGRTGKRYASLWPDDWELSRKFHSAGLKLVATSAPLNMHFDGGVGYPNFGTPIGWETDIQNGPLTPWRIAQRQGFGLDMKMAGKLARTPDGETRIVATARMEGAVTMLVFQDGSRAPMADCTAL